MGENATVVTKERLAEGYSYRDYVANVQTNKERFDENYAKAQLSEADREFFADFNKSIGRIWVLAIAEDWCPDVYTNLPVVQRIVEAAGNMEMMIFPRDENLDIMNEFLNQGKFQSIPTCVFYTKDLQYIATWTERPALANRERAEFEARFKGLPEQEMRAKVRELTQPRWPAWQHETVWEIIELLKKSRTK